MQPKTLRQWVIAWSVVWIVISLAEPPFAYVIGILLHHPEHHMVDKMLSSLTETPRVVMCAVIGYKCLQWQQKQHVSEGEKQTIA